jgi:integrase
MKRIHLTSDWLSNWTPARITEVADRGCKGLVVRGGPTGTRTFYRWSDVRDDATSKLRRKRVRLGSWPALSLADAQKAVHEAREARQAETAGTVDLTVKQVAEAYRRDILSHRERADEAWNIIRVHVVEARPDSRRLPFGQWSARMVRPADLASVVRFAKEPRIAEARSRNGQATSRRLGGPGVARVVLRELKALFAHAVETGALEMTPAGVMRARSFGLRASSRNRILDVDELRAFFDALDLTALLEHAAKRRRLSPTTRLALAFQLYVPLRSHSLIGARWEEVDLGAARWTVPVERLKLHAADRVTARPFIVPLPPTAVAILRGLRALAGSSPWVLASPLPAQKGKKPKHVEPKALVRALARLQAASENGMARLRFASRLTVHDLRRTWRSLAMDLGIDHAVARLSLGHAGLEGVEGVYGRAQMVERRAEAAERVAAALDRIRLGMAAQLSSRGEQPERGRAAEAPIHL